MTDPTPNLDTIRKCIYCNQAWPCDTVTVLAAYDTAAEDRDLALALLSEEHDNHEAEVARLSADLTEARQQNDAATRAGEHWARVAWEATAERDRLHDAITTHRYRVHDGVPWGKANFALWAVLDPVEAAEREAVDAAEATPTARHFPRRDEPTIAPIPPDDATIAAAFRKAWDTVRAPAASPPATTPTLADECEKWAQERWATSYSAADLLTRAAAALRAGASPPAEPPPTTPPIEDDAHDPEAWGRAPATEPEATP